MTMPAGKYYIGDLCYVMHDEWDEVCHLLFGNSQTGRIREGEFVLKDGRRFACYSTAYGDGEYVSNIDTRHCVDAGVIGCIHVEDIRDDTYDHVDQLGAVVTFDQPFETAADQGLLKFGHVEIETAGAYDFEQ